MPDFRTTEITAGQPLRFYVNSFSPEERLLIRCAECRSADNPAALLARIHLTDIDWHRFIRLADQQEIYPLIQQNLVHLPRPAVPQDARNYVLNQFHANARRSLLQTAILLELIPQLKAKNIDHLVYKGPALAVMAYENLLHRQYCDLDILVSRQHLPEVHAIVTKLGFHWQESSLNMMQKWFYLTNNCEYHYINAAKKVSLEVHWRFFENHIRFPLDMPDVWARRRSVMINNLPVDTLSPEDHLLVLIAHGGGKHHWSNLKMIADMAALIRQMPQLDWHYLQKQAQRLGIMRLFHAAMLLVADLLNTSLPQSVLASSHDDAAATEIAKMVIANLFLTPEEKMSRSTRGTDKSRFYLQTRENTRDRLPHFWHVIQDIFTPTDQEEKLFPLPGFLRFLHRILRPLRLVVKYVGNWIK